MDVLLQSLVLLASAQDGASAWAEFVAGVRATFAEQGEATRRLAVGLTIVLVIVMDVWVGKWILRRWRARRARATAGTDLGADGSRPHE